MEGLALRAAMSGAAFLLLATGFAVLSLSTNDPLRADADDLARFVARTIDQISAIDGALRLRSGPGELVPVPVSLAGNAFSLQFRTRDVRVVARGAQATAPVREPLCPFAPGPGRNECGPLHPGVEDVLRVESGSDFIIERAPRMLDGTHSYQTFVYLPP